ncbi:hypothetical protein AMECASPLE_034213 [Ameca splendens]|uniref:Secreted protein n=1 Tax=Ameca splendens TaxID=208324 RepID=A0ABV0Z5B7_9TELE
MLLLCFSGFLWKGSQSNMGLSLMCSLPFPSSKPFVYEQNWCQLSHLWLRGLTDGLRESLISTCRDKSDSKTVLLRRGAERETEASEQKSHTQAPKQTVCLKTCFKGLLFALLDCPRG